MPWQWRRSASWEQPWGGKLSRKRGRPPIRTSWHALAVEEVSKLGAALGRQTEQEEREAPSQLFHKLMVLLMKGNCTLFLNRSPPEE